MKGLEYYGLDSSEIRQICAITEMKNNPVKLSVDDLVEVVQRSMIIK